MAKKHIYTRAEAAEILYDYQKHMEATPLSLNTVYKKIYTLPNGNWHLEGRGYDYTLPPNAPTEG